MRNGLKICSMFFLLFFHLSSTHAQSADTTLFSNGGPGPYSFTKRYVNSSSIRIFFRDSSQVPPWTFVSSLNAVLFSESIDSGVPIQILYQTDYYGLDKTYSLFPKNFINPLDTIQISSSTALGAPLRKENENLNVSGYKSVGVAVGSFGQINLEQGLDVRISGEIRPGTEISAHLTDQGTSLDGATREISEFDMIYITLSDPRFGATAGDQYINWPISGILKGQKKIKGLSAFYSPQKFLISAFGALSGGSHTTQTWRGQNGVQGPYTLSGKGEPGFITPIGGTVLIKVNGKELKEGDDLDFTVDYDLGSITFTPKVLIRDEDLIRVEYEYKMFEYQRSLLGTSAGFSTPDSTISVKGALWSEADNRNHPIDALLSSEDTLKNYEDTLKNSGDSPPFVLSYRSVHPNDVSSDDALYPLYIMARDSSGAFYFKHKRYNPASPDSTGGFYYVWFTDMGKGNGEYVMTDSIIHREIVYVYKGPGNGNFSPRAKLASPQRVTAGEITADLKLDLLTARIDIAGREMDKNLFSPYDDNDNLGSSAIFSFLAGRKDIQKPGIWITGKYHYSSRQFGYEFLEAFDRYENWNDSALFEQKAMRQLWESGLGFTPVSGLQTEFGYGQNRAESRILTDKVSNTSRFLIGKHLSLLYNGTLFRHHEHLLKGWGQKERANLSFSSNNHSADLLYRDDWNADSLENGTGLIGGGLKYRYLPWNLQQSLSFTEYRSGQRLFNSIDTGYSITWEQSTDNHILPWWRLSGLGNYQRNFYIAHNETSTFLIDLNSTIRPEGAGFSSDQHYRTNSERASAFIQVPYFAGKGLGTHVFDDSLKEYVPHTPGDWFMQQREVYDQTSSLRVRKTLFDINWAFDPVRKIPGILNDLSWAGNLSLEEHIDAEVTKLSSWLPGYNSLMHYYKSNFFSPVSYTNLYYRQEIRWSPEKNDNIRGNLFVTPSFKEIRSYQEPGIESGLDLELKKGKWTLGDETRFIYFFHDDTLERDFFIRDLNTVLEQKFRVGNSFDIYLKECIGWARKDDRLSILRTTNLDSSIYLQLNPGITWQPFNRGWAEASYTLSSVRLPGELDYRVARGFGPGLSHVFSITADVQTGEHFSVNCSYRGEVRKLSGEKEYRPGEHIVSLQVKAFL